MILIYLDSAMPIFVFLAMFRGYIGVKVGPKVVKSKLPCRSPSIALGQLNPIHKKGP